MTESALPTVRMRRTVAATAPMGALRRGVREVGLTLITVGVAIVLFVVYQLWGTGFTERHDQSLLRRQFERASAQALHHAAAPTTTGATTATTAAAGGTAGGSTAGDNPTVGPPAPNPAADGQLAPSVPVGTAVDHLVIPAIGVNKYIVQGTAEDDLMQGPGHYVGTPLPGAKGNAAIAGHRTTYGAPFFSLNNLRTGDWIYITDTAGRTFDYRVVGHDVVSPSDIAVLAPTKRAQLTLTTCNPPFSATSRLVVVAALVGRPAPAAAVAPPVTTPPKSSTAAATSPTTTTTSSAANAGLGGGNTNAWPPAIAYGAAAAGLWVLTRLAVARSRRWRRFGAFVGGVALCAVPLWFCFENVVRLLPPSI